MCYHAAMKKRRREIGPKKEKNLPALLRFAGIALLVAVVGVVIAWLLGRLIGPAPVVATDEEKAVSVFYYLPGMLVIATVLAVLALLFFGVRAYMMGTKVRQSIQQGRMKIKRG